MAPTRAMPSRSAFGRWRNGSGRPVSAKRAETASASVRPPTRVTNSSTSAWRKKPDRKEAPAMRRPFSPALAGS